jgi:hypothetical protein
VCAQHGRSARQIPAGEQLAGLQRDRVAGLQVDEGHWFLQKAVLRLGAGLAWNPL